MKLKKMITKMRKLFICCLISIALMFTVALADYDEYMPFTWKTSPDRLSLQDKTTVSALSSLVGGNWYAWNAIEDNVAVLSYSTSIEGDIRVYTESLGETVYGKNGIYAPGVAGKITLMKPSFTGDAHYSVITLNSKLTSQLTYEWQVKVFVHELGHALALDHPLDFDCTASAIMQQGSALDPAANSASKVITTHDEKCLQAKW